MKKGKLIATLRLSMGFIFFWTFLDKTFGLGLSTAPSKSWLAGNSPTTGFLTNGTSGPLAQIFQNMSGSPVTDWLFMLGMGLVGLSLILGIGMTIATYSGALMMFLIYLSIFPPKTNPFVDQHIIYIISLFVLKTYSAGDFYGLGTWWKKQKLVKKYPLLI